jgi:hypothetical protein
MINARADANAKQEELRLMVGCVLIYLVGPFVVVDVH